MHRDSPKTMVHNYTGLMKKKTNKVDNTLNS